jgi:flagellar biosynthetic protein FlhB
MADQPAQERTEQPTPRRMLKARDEGQIPRSQELLAVTVLMAGTLALAMSGAGLGRGIGSVLLLSRDWLASGPMTSPEAATVLRGLVRTVLGALAPILLAVLLPVLLVGGLQARGVLSLKPIAPKWSRINPGAGLKRLLGPDGLFTLFKAIAKLLVLGAVTWGVLTATWPSIAALTGAGAMTVLAVTRATAMRIGLLAGGAFLGVALLDFLFMNWKHHKQLRMTKQELVQEHRETEGDPLLKSRIRSLAQQLGRKRMLQRVKDADVVIVNPTHLAVALRYDAGSGGAPMVVAMGRRKLAERIRALATAARVPVVQNVTVARALMATAKVGQPIPPALYAAIAEILAFVYRQHGRTPAALSMARPR